MLFPEEFKLYQRLNFFGDLLNSTWTFDSVLPLTKTFKSDF